MNRYQQKPHKLLLRGKTTLRPILELRVPLLLALLLGALLLPMPRAAAQSAPNPQQDQQDQQDSANPANLARISFTAGSVQTAAGEKAVMNMPVLSGTDIQTGADGQLEIAFNDGSVARLAPNSSLEVTQIGASGVTIEQLSGLGYYELNTGDGHPPFQVNFHGVALTPTANSIFRLDLDATPQVSVMSGGVQMAGQNLPTAELGEGQSLDFSASGSTPYTIANSIAPNSWDQWNQERDAAISEQAGEQTTARDTAGDTDSNSWNDLDYYGNWYPVTGYGNVWVPGGVGAGWDPYGYGYWGMYPGFGYTWISGYPWGWLPYHCGSWNYFAFGWGWMPGGCGYSWYPVAPIQGYAGYIPPVRPVVPLRAGGRIPAQRLITVNRGARAYGPWGPGFQAGAGGRAPIVDHSQRPTLRVGNQTIRPLPRQSLRGAAFAGNRGTTPGVRSMLGAAPPTAYPVHIGRPGAPAQSGVHGRAPATMRGGARPQPRQDTPVMRPQPSRSQYPRSSPQPRMTPPPRPMPRPQENRPARAPQMRAPVMRAPSPAPVMRPAPSMGGGGGHSRR